MPACGAWVWVEFRKAFHMSIAALPIAASSPSAPLPPSDSASSRRTVCRLGFEGLSIRLRPLVQGDAIRGLARAKAWAEHGGAEAGIGRSVSRRWRGLLARGSPGVETG